MLSCKTTSAAARVAASVSTRVFNAVSAAERVAASVSIFACN